MSIINIQSLTFKLPVIRLDGKDYFITGGTYQKLHNERIITEEYTAAGEISRSVVLTGKHRWQMTLHVPASYTQVGLPADMQSLQVGDRTYLHATLAKEPPSDLLEFYDVVCNGNFSGTYTHLVYLSADWEAPHNDDIGEWVIPISLWGYDRP